MGGGQAHPSCSRHYYLKMAPPPPTHSHFWEDVDLTPVFLCICCFEPVVLPNNTWNNCTVIGDDFYLHVVQCIKCFLPSSRRVDCVFCFFLNRCQWIISIYFLILKASATCKHAAAVRHCKVAPITRGLCLISCSNRTATSATRQATAATPPATWKATTATDQATTASNTSKSASSSSNSSNWASSNSSNSANNSSNTSNLASNSSNTSNLASNSSNSSRLHGISTWSSKWRNLGTALSGSCCVWKASSQTNNKFSLLNPFSSRPHQNAFWYNNSWLGFLKILTYLSKERGKKISTKNEPSFVAVKCCKCSNGS